MNPLTVGQLRLAIKDLPDDAPVYPDWLAGHEPNEDQPGVELCGFDEHHKDDKGNPYLGVIVKLYYLDDDPCDLCGELLCVCDTCVLEDLRSVNPQSYINDDNNWKD